ncbi:MAG TPA: hypothetical protein VN442_24195 [Bryobacteraceae bacterium]|nr:hypothetical protein [Bryobacteraceae bacterium]
MCETTVTWPIVRQRLPDLPEPFDHPAWIYELKYDGFRALVYIEDGRARLVSRNGNTFKSFPELTAAIGPAGMWLHITGTRSQDRTGTIGLWAFVTVVTMLYIGNLAGPPQPSARAVAVVGLAARVFPMWAAWLGGQRIKIVQRSRIHYPICTSASAGGGWIRTASTARPSSFWVKGLA